MKILMAGNFSGVSNEFFTEILQEHEVVIYSAQADSLTKDKKLTLYPKNTEREEEELLKLFEGISFDIVVYFSQAIDGTIKIFDELEQLESILYFSKENKIEQFYYVTTNDIWSRKEEGLEEQGSRAVLLQACEALCQNTAQLFPIKMYVIRIPHIYSCGTDNCYLRDKIKQGIVNGEIVFRGVREMETDFLCDEDLGNLLNRMFEEIPLDNYLLYAISGENGMTLKQLTEMLQTEISVKVKYIQNHHAMPGILKIGEVRRTYGWFPKHDFTQDIQKIMIRMKEEQKELLLQKDKKKSYFMKYAKQGVEMLLLFLLATGVNYSCRNNIFMNTFDFNLVLVSGVALMNGMNAGLIAAAFASMSYVLLHAFPDWRILFYNVQNWIPFASYFLLGAMFGSKKDKYDDMIRFSKEEQKVLEDKYDFLNKIYQKVLENKKEYGNQIVGYQNSFGRVYEIVKKLDSFLPDKILMEAVDVLEDVLNNQSVAIYTSNGKSRKIRLAVCSKEYDRNLSYSFDLSEHKRMEKKLLAGEIFVNQECREHEPAYAAPVMHQGILYGVITLQRAGEEQMNMEYRNKFKLITDLIHTSLVRAMEYEKASSEEKMIPNTRIVKEEYFNEILKSREEMKKKEYLRYMLLHVQGKIKNMEAFSKKVTALIRTNDIIGQGKNGEIYLLLAQTSGQEISIIHDRMKKSNISFEVISEEKV